MKKLVKDWLLYAEKDLITITEIIDNNLLFNIVAFHSHQCIEKAFKAVILDKTKEIL